MTKIYYRDVPPGANEDSVATGQAQPFWSGALNRVEQDAPATLEQGEWPLDGSRSLIPGDAAQMGFWSQALSGEDGSFSQPISLTLTLGRTYTATGVTMVFDGRGENYCTHCSISWFRGGVRLADQELYPEGSTVVLNREVEAFDSLRLTFYAVNRPGHFLRLNRLMVGMEQEFGPDELQECRIFQETDVLSTSLTGNTLDFTLSEQKGRVLRFQNRQPFEVWRNGALMGRFYLKDSHKTQRNLYRVSCVDAIGVLADTPTLGGMVEEIEFGRLVEDILAGQFEAEVHPDLAGERLSGWLPVGSKRDALLQAAFAVGAMVTTVGGRLRFLPVARHSQNVEKAREIFTGGTVTEKPTITEVTLTAHDYRLGTDRETVTEENVASGVVTYRVEKPCGQYRVTGGTILDSGANHVTVSAAGGALTITALPYQDISTSLTWKNPRATASDVGNGLEIGQATLLNPSRLDAVMERIREYVENRQELKQKIVYQGQEPGEMITSEKPFDGQLVGYLTQMDLNLSGRGVAEITIIGKNVELEAVAGGFCGATESGVDGWS